MPGGGFFKVGPGQITDDSELAMSLLWALTECKSTLNGTIFCKHYKKWVDSRPFDIGNNTRATIGKLSNLKADDKNVFKKFKLETENASTKSISNGSLMRLSPLFVWSQNLNVE